MAAGAKPARKKRKKRPIPINPETGLPYSKGTLKMRLLNQRDAGDTGAYCADNAHCRPLSEH